MPSLASPQLEFFLICRVEIGGEPFLTPENDASLLYALMSVRGPVRRTGCVSESWVLIRKDWFCSWPELTHAVVNACVPCPGWILRPLSWVSVPFIYLRYISICVRSTQDMSLPPSVYFTCYKMGRSRHFLIFSFGTVIESRFVWLSYGSKSWFSLLKIWKLPQNTVF